MFEEMQRDWIVVSEGEMWLDNKGLVCHSNDFGFHHVGKEKP